MSGSTQRIPLRARLREPDPLLGVFSILPAPDVPRALALGGFDVVVVDLEHGPFGIEAVPAMVLAAKSGGAYAVVRVRTGSPSRIGAALDAGADGVLVPQVQSATAAAEAVAAARFSPDGSRGANPFVAAAGYLASPDWYAEANASVAVMTMVEGRGGLDALDSIIATPGLDCVFVGPFDLSHALGVPGETSHPTVVKEIERIVTAAAAAGVATGIFAPTPAYAAEWAGRGVRFVAQGVDTALLVGAARGAVAAIREAT